MTKCKYIDDYLQKIEKKEIPASKEIKQAVTLIKNKLSQDGVFVDTEKTDKAIELIVKYFDIKLFDWELFVLALVHCYYPDDTLVFTEFLIMMGRGNGKNGFISGLAWYLTTHYHGVVGYNIDIIANSEEQAKTSFEDVYEMLENTWTKSKKFFYKSKELIKNIKTKSYIKFNTSNAKTKDGKRSACLIFDEIHEYENDNTIKVFRSGFGKRKHSRTFYITTNGYIRDGVLDNKLAIARDVLNGEIPSSRLCPLIYKMDSDEECKDKRLWVKANPSLPYLKTLQIEMDEEFLTKDYETGVELDFYTKRMNLPRSDKEIAVTEWQNIKATDRLLPDLAGWSCTVGIDYAQLRDWAAVNFHFKKGDERFDFGCYWVCTRNPELSRIKVPWETWDACIPVDDVEISADLLAEYIFEQGQKYYIKKIVVDNHKYSLVKKALADIGFDAKERKNVQVIRPSDIMKVQPVIDSCFNRNLFTWGDNPALRWAVNNTKLIRVGKKNGVDKGNFEYGKIEAKSRKTDPFMALVHSMIAEDELENSISTFDDLPVIIC